MPKEIAAPAAERNTSAIAFRPISRLTLREVANERLGLLELLRSVDDELLRHRILLRLLVLNGERRRHIEGLAA